MDPQQIAELNRNYFYYILAANVAIGLLLGLVPLVMGIKRGKKNVGIISLLLCGVAGALSPILSLVIAIAATILIVRSKAVQTGTSDSTSES